MKSLLTSGGVFDEPGGSSAIELEPVLAIGSSIAGASELDPGLDVWFSSVDAPGIARSVNR